MDPTDDYRPNFYRYLDIEAHTSERAVFRAPIDDLSSGSSRDVALAHTRRIATDPSLASESTVKLISGSVRASPESGCGVPAVTRLLAVRRPPPLLFATPTATSNPHASALCFAVARAWQENGGRKRRA